MTETTPSAAQIRQRLDYHATIQANAEARRASLLADRADAIAVLSAGELDEIDDEVDSLAVTIERAGSRVTALRPALAAAEAREAEADARQRANVERVAFGTTRSATLDVLASDPERQRSAAQAALAANGPVVSEYNPAIFDPKPAPVVTRVDEKAWHAAREARLAAEAGTPLPRTAPTSADFGRPGPSAAASLSR